jgi:hypothetical protein
MTEMMAHSMKKYPEHQGLVAPAWEEHQYISYRMVTIYHNNTTFI